MVKGLTQIAEEGVQPHEVHLIPAIEKELLHYDLLAALEELGVLERLVFRGGTCLRLCYGAKRRSEDLAFAYAGNLEELNLSTLERVINKMLYAEIRPRCVRSSPTKDGRICQCEDATLVDDGGHGSRAA